MNDVRGLKYSWFEYGKVGLVVGIEDLSEDGVGRS